MAKYDLNFGFTLYNYNAWIPYSSEGDEVLTGEERLSYDQLLLVADREAEHRFNERCAFQIFSALAGLEFLPYPRIRCPSNRRSR